MSSDDFDDVLSFIWCLIGFIASCIYIDSHNVQNPLITLVCCMIAVAITSMCKTLTLFVVSIVLITKFFIG